MPRILDESFWPKDLSNYKPSWRDPVAEVSFATLPKDPVNYDTVFDKKTGWVYSYLIRLGAWVKYPPMEKGDTDLRILRLKHSEKIYYENLMSYLEEQKGALIAGKVEEFHQGIYDIIQKRREEMERI